MAFIQQTHDRLKKEKLKEMVMNRGSTGKTTTKSAFKNTEQFMQPGQALLALQAHQDAMNSPGGAKKA